MNTLESNKKLITKDFKKELIKFCKDNDLSIEKMGLKLNKEIYSGRSMISDLSISRLVEEIHNNLIDQFGASDPRKWHSCEQLTRFEIEKAEGGEIPDIYRNTSYIKINCEFYWWGDTLRFLFIAYIKR